MTLNQMLFFNVKKHHSTSTTRWQDSWIGNWLSNGLTSVISRSDAPRLSPVGFCERQGLCSTSACNCPQAEESNMKTERTEQPFLQTFCMQLNIIHLMRARQQIKHILYFHWVLRWEGDFCGYYFLTITFMCSITLSVITLYIHNSGSSSSKVCAQ